MFCLVDFDNLNCQTNLSNFRIPSNTLTLENLSNMNCENKLFRLTSASKDLTDPKSKLNQYNSLRCREINR